LALEKPEIPQGHQEKGKEGFSQNKRNQAVIRFKYLSANGYRGQDDNKTGQDV
jgi:hypothetical protein